MTTNLERLKADLAAIPPHWRVLCWSGWDQPYPPAANFREYLFTAGELLAALTGQPIPDDPTFTGKVNASAGLRVRKAPVDGEIVTILPNNTEILLYEQAESDFYKIAAGVHKGYWVAAAYIIRAR